MNRRDAPRFSPSPFLSLLLGALAVGIPSAPAWPSQGWGRILSDHAVVRFHPPDSLLAERVRDDVADGWDRVARNLGVVSPPPVTVFVAGSAEEFRALTAGAVPDWGVGCALPAHRTIVLRRPPGAARDLRETVFHEISHILLHDTAGGRAVPVWFDEGVAMWNASEWRWGQSYEMAAAALSGNLLSLSEIDDVLTFASPKAHLAYAESFFAVSHIVQAAGPGAIARILRDVQAGSPFQEALSRTVGVSPAAFEALYLEAVRGRFGPAALLSDTPGLWLGLTALFLVAYLATRLRTRRKVRQWEAEEEPEPPFLKVHREPSHLEPPDRVFQAMVIGVTGGLGSGKSSVCRLFASWGAWVVDADQVGREVVAWPEVLKPLAEAFGGDIVDPEGRLDRRLLGRRAFADPASRDRLNRIVWPPLVRKLTADVEAARRERPDRPVVVDAALLYEWGDLTGFDAVVVVTADKEVRKARMMSRMGLSEAEVEARMRAQLPEEEKVRRADHVIVNNGTETDLQARAREVWERLRVGDRKAFDGRNPQEDPAV